MWTDLRTAVAFLTILPVGYPEGHQPGRAFAYFPLVGLLLGFIVAALASLRLFPPEVVALLTLAVWVILTGGLHLDGFGDSCDGLLATVTPERRLDIMKDPRAGSWAVIGLVMLLLGKYATLRHIDPLLLILPPVLGRWSMVLAAYNFPYARPSGMGAYFRQGLGQGQLVTASISSLLVGLILYWLYPQRFALVACLAITPLIVVLVGRWSAGRLGGGLTGDVYGALCELTELVCLIGLSAL